jgi:hypothetical protein
MTTIRIKLTSALPAERVLFAAHDFGKRRFDVWPAVRAAHFAVHSQGDKVADVTEGTPTGIGTSWERCQYDWSAPGVVVATVTDSNVYAVPGSAWRLTAADSNDGSHIEMTWTRRFRRTPRGILFATLFRLLGRPLFRRYAGEVIANLERLDAVQADPAEV